MESIRETSGSRAKRKLVQARSQVVGSGSQHDLGYRGESVREPSWGTGWANWAINLRCQFARALTPMRPPRDPQNGQVLDPSWTLIKDAGIGCPALSSLSIPAISHFRKSSRQDRTVTAQREWFP